MDSWNKSSKFCLIKSSKFLYGNPNIFCGFFFKNISQIKVTYSSLSFIWYSTRYWLSMMDFFFKLSIKMRVFSLDNACASLRGHVLERYGYRHMLDLHYSCLSLLACVIWWVSCHWMVLIKNYYFWCPSMFSNNT